MKNLLILLLVLVFTGCESKKYFEPDDVYGDVYSSGYLPDYIKDTKRNGATLDNNQFISKYGLSDIKLTEDFLYVNDTSEYVLSANENNKLEYINKSTKERKILNFDRKVVTSTIGFDMIIAVTLDNSVHVYDLVKKEFVKTIKNNIVNSIDSRIASPVFYNSLVLVPLLDGKVLLLDKASKKVIKSFTVDTKNHFSNVIFMSVLDDKLLIATQHNILSITDNGTDFNELSIRDVILFKNRIYILARDGNIHILDDELKIVKSKKLKFAVFTGAVNGKYMYALEREGYLVAVDEDLITTNVYDFSEIDNEKIAIIDNKVYFDNKYFELDK
jgi:hypothetical protein